MKKQARPIRWPKPDEHRIFLEWTKQQRDHLFYTDSQGREHYVKLDHSRCPKLRP